MAIASTYTRKSTEHNLDLAFNSLDAQREACEAYVKSQAHEGWTLLREGFDDGGLSGASLDRPDALERRVVEIEEATKKPIAITEGHLSLSPHKANPILFEWLPAALPMRAQDPARSAGP